MASLRNAPRMVFCERHLVMMRRGSASSRYSREVVKVHCSVPLPVYSKCCFWKPVEVNSVWVSVVMDVISMQAIVADILERRGIP